MVDILQYSYHAGSFWCCVPVVKRIRCYLMSHFVEDASILYLIARFLISFRTAGKVS